MTSETGTALPYRRPENRLVPRPLPPADAFWTGGGDGELRIHRCRGCGHFFHPPGPACFRCRSTDVGPERVSGRGRVAAWTVNHQPWIPGFDPPYVVAMIEIDEEPDVRVVSNVVDVAPAALTVGLPVEVFFEERDDVWVPLFRPLEGAES